MLAIFFWAVVYSIIVAASIIFIGRPIENGLSLKELLKLLLDWRFLLGGILALCARFIFVIINNLASKQPNLQNASLTIAALATMGSVVTIILANYFFLGEQLRLVQGVGVLLILTGIFFVFR
jgi:drug/metabolite transporter (DMT)-like permease